MTLALLGNSGHVTLEGAEVMRYRLLSQLGGPYVFRGRHNCLLTTFKTHTPPAYPNRVTLSLPKTFLGCYFGTSCNMTSQAKVKEYGSWKSPITSQLATQSTVSFQEVQVDRAPGFGDAVYWSELRYDEGGRYIICSSKSGQSDFTAWTPKGFNARTRVHEYGGGAFCVHKGTLYFTNFSDQRFYKQTATDDQPKPVTAEGSGRLANAHYSEKLERIYSVCEDHSKVQAGEAKEATNTVIVLNPETKQQNVLASGCDFYSAPQASPDGTKLCWVQWNHPNMPWDSTEIWVGELDASGDSLKEGSAKKVAGGDGISVMYPGWTMDNQLLYIGDQTDWWNLYVVTPTGEHVNLAPKEAELGHPQWIFAEYPYDVDPSGSGQIAVTYKGELAVVDVKTKDYKKLDTGYKLHDFVRWSSNGNIYAVAGEPTQFPCVISFCPQSQKTDVLRLAKSLPVEKGYLSVPEKISWPTADGETAHGYFYPPQNKDFVAPEGSLPMLVVKAHGGPTSAANSMLNFKVQYYTSRGAAVLDVDYRGSTGYGKQYRNKLRKNWGICDVDDCSNGALYLAKAKKVDANHLCIQGGSAGGYTTLACLAFKDVFKAGGSHYGVADVEALAKDTHKFESRYLDNLIGPYPESKDVYAARSAINHIHKFNCPIAFFQGEEDKIVPPNQAEMMHKAVKAKGLPCVYVLFEGEQHGFRKAENVQKAMDGEMYFFARVFGIEPPDSHFHMDIDNLKEQSNS